MKSETPLRELTACARAGLKGVWGRSICVVVVYTLIMAGLEMVPVGGWLLQLITAPPLVVGMHLYFIRTIRRQDNPFSLLFQGFDRFWTALAAYVLVTLIVLAWISFCVAISSVLLIGMLGMSIPPSGIGLWLAGVMLLVLFGGLFYLQLRFAQVLYLIADNPSIRIIESLRRSGQLMEGNYLRLFLLWLRFTGWFLLGALTLGIGLLWVIPYMAAATAAFYNDLARSASSEWIEISTELPEHVV